MFGGELADRAAQKRQTEAATANLKARKAELEEAKKLGPEKLDEIHRLVGMNDPKALVPLRKYRDARATIAELKRQNDPGLRTQIERLENTRDENATAVFEQFESTLRALQTRIEVEERQIMKADGVWVPKRPK
jgi:hypothetical protein